MGKIKTSAIFYRRGVSNGNRDFGFAIQSNWPIIQPVSLYIASQNINNSPSIPSPPTNVVGTRGNTQVSLTWTAPLSNGGSQITSYTATSNPGGFTASSATTNVIVTGLTNGTPYTFTVIATNSIGNSAPSSASSAVTPATVPGAPINVVGTRGNTQVSLTWSAPVSNGGDSITSYTATSNPGGFTASSATTNVIVTGLTNGTPYTFTVIATNSVGNSVSSSASSAVTPATVPGAPTNVLATSGAISDSANISWTAPVSNGGDSITSYTATSNPGGLTGTATFPTTNVTITGLTNGTPYTFTVVATNSVGNSAPSSASNSITPTNLPAPSVWYDPSDPTKVTLVSGGVDALTDLTVNGYNGQYNSPFAATYIRPTYNVLPINGLATFRINNSTSDVQMISVPGYNFNDQFISYAIVIRYISGTSGIIATDTPGLFGRGFGCDVTPSAGTLQTISYNAFTTWDGTPSPNIQISVNTPSILIASISAGNWIFSLNGTQYTLLLTQAKSPDNSNGLNIGCWNPSNSASIIFDCGEILAYTSFLSSTQIEAVEGYLATKWGLTSSLPPSHPYYSP
jgi:hypothetical protein